MKQAPHLCPTCKRYWGHDYCSVLPTDPLHIRTYCDPVCEGSARYGFLQVEWWYEDDFGTWVAEVRRKAGL